MKHLKLSKRELDEMKAVMGRTGRREGGDKMIYLEIQNWEDVENYMKTYQAGILETHKTGVDPVIRLMATYTYVKIGRMTPMVMPLSQQMLDYGVWLCVEAIQLYEEYLAEQGGAG